MHIFAVVVHDLLVTRTHKEDKEIMMNTRIRNDVMNTNSALTHGRKRTVVKKEMEYSGTSYAFQGNQKPVIPFYASGEPLTTTAILQIAGRTQEFRVLK